MIESHHETFMRPPYQYEINRRNINVKYVITLRISSRTTIAMLQVRTTTALQFATRKTEHLSKAVII